MPEADPLAPPSAPAPPPSPVPYGTYVCSPGSRQVFAKVVTYAAHYLLFYLAVVHILFSLLTSVITNIKLSKWSVLEQTARAEQNIPQVAFMRIASTVDRSNTTEKLPFKARAREALRDAIGFVDQDLYSLLRFMCEKRFRAHHVVLKNYNFLNMCEQCLEAELNEVYSHAWLLVFMMALLLLYNRVVYQIVWISALCILAMAFMAGNMRWVMKKTAREARNLWRKIHGQGGIEVDEEDDAEAFGVRSAGEGATASELVEAEAAAAGKAGDLSGDQVLGPGGAASLPVRKQLRFAPGPVGEGTEAEPRAAGLMLVHSGEPGGTVDALPSGAGGGGSSGRQGGGRGACWLVSMVESGQEARKAIKHQRREALAGDAVAGLAAPTCLTARGRGAAAGSAAAGPAAGGRAAAVAELLRSRRLAGQAGPGCRPRPSLGPGSGPGPVAEATVDNPLYGQYGMAGGMHYGAGAGGGMGYGYGMPANGVGMGMGTGMGLAGGGMGYGGGGGSGAMQQQPQQQPYAGAVPPAHPAPWPAASAHASAHGREAGLGDSEHWGSHNSSGAAPPDPEPEADATQRSSSSSGTSSSSSSGSRSRAARKKHGAGKDEDGSSVHSEKSILEHELAAGIETKITRLFFFGRPFLLLWLFNVIFAQASLTMTMSLAFIIPYDKFDSIRQFAQPIYVWLPVVLSNVFLVFYGCWVFLPQYALLSVTGVLEPHEVMLEIKNSKTQDDSEEGIVRWTLEKLTHTFVGRHDGETRLSTAFIVSLASQAGIILGKDYKAEKHINATPLKVMYKELVLVWHDIAWYGELTSTYRIKTDVAQLHEAFNELDEDGSGALSFSEIANMIRSLGTYATTGDVEAMLWEIDIDGSHSVGYDEFVKFLTYAFFDTRQLGYIDADALLDGMERLGLPLSEMQAAVLMTVGHCDPDEEVKVTLRQFFEMFEKVSFDEEEEEGEGGSKDGSAKGSFLGRALGALRAPSRMISSLLLPSSRQDSGSARAQAGGSASGTATPATGTGTGMGSGAGRGGSGSLEVQYSGGLSRGVSGIDGASSAGRSGVGLGSGGPGPSPTGSVGAKGPSRLALMSRAGQ
ncbi:hypothetical protein HYH03_017578 [Edaphochlamys debaryana]|uniref:EF-hand domain-containing protein n=1 Tax=Edaphochlamys debaryana TaxID=47281 RepID=A0A835XGZ6_9CHLO|nr:hypothetical protein HYH03_017578 [Edaphochlamys debaryana]|eukprot:KAG2483571.1 hypothetical protein HYH03_017578 [Edaphochlamys debaryana]